MRYRLRMPCKLPILVGLDMKKILTVILASLSMVSVAQAEAVVGSADAGKEKVAMCIGCHGIPGYRTTFPYPHHVPKISGQTAGYITAALEAYRSGKRKYPTMQGIAASLSDQDIADIAAFYEQDGGVTEVAATVAAPSEAVAQLFNRDPANNCTTCHGANFSTPNSATVPLLAGQHADYLYMALKSYKKDKNVRHFGRDNAVMGGNVTRYTNAELEAMADYIASVPGKLKIVSQDFKK